ncbi:MAG: tetratricopeptide repeat protein [Myxococcales bacterium]|nr:tetratricopeptide repeat protein [Myxococcales bacterium]
MRALAAMLVLLGLPGRADAQLRWPGDPRPSPMAARAEEEGAMLNFEALMPTPLLPRALIELSGLSGARATLRRMAEQRYERASSLGHDTPAVLAARCEAAARRRDHALARPLCERVIALAPEGSAAQTARFELAFMASIERRDREAVALYRALLRAPLGASFEAIVWGNLAESDVALGALDDAVDAYEHATALDPERPLHWLGLALTQDRLGTPWVEAGLRAYATAAQRAPRGLTRGEALVAALLSDSVVFVPAYERHAHMALAFELSAEALRRDPGPLDAALATRGLINDALQSWSAYRDAARPDDPWRAQAERHLRALTARLRTLGSTPPR